MLRITQTRSKEPLSKSLCLSEKGAGGSFGDGMSPGGRGAHWCRALTCDPSTLPAMRGVGHVQRLCNSDYN